jgi:soluble lytic murein transglycosylase-like protein
MKKHTFAALVLLAAAGAARADCIDDAARSYGTHADVLRAIAIVESHARPAAVNVNDNGSVDRGLYQINSVHLPELARVGIGPDDLHDVCLSSYVAALLLKRKMKVLGDTWEAVGAYHSNLPQKRDAYARKVRDIFESVRRIRLALGNR